MGVDPALAMAFAQQESGFNHQSVSPANAIGTMQVIPDAGEWASGLVGRKLNLLDPQDNVTAGVAIIRALLQGAPSESEAIAGYYQGQYSVSVNGMFAGYRELCGRHQGQPRAVPVTNQCPVKGIKYALDEKGPPAQCCWRSLFHLTPKVEGCKISLMTR